MDTPDTDAVLRIADLSVCYSNGAQAVRSVSLELAPGECLALVGESGCGKTSVAHAILGLLPRRTTVAGSIVVGGVEVVGASRRTIRRLRGHTIGYVGQDPYAACDPLRSVRHHVEEGWTAVRATPPTGAAIERLEALGIDQAGHRAQARPNQWSGGMLQRATIAAATVHRPALTVADEPTSALDADRSDGVLQILREATDGLLLVSHDLSLVGRHADRIAVMYHGRIVEAGPASEVLSRARHPYTRALVAASPRPGHGLPEELEGAPPSLLATVPGCSFRARCHCAGTGCDDRVPVLRDGVACHHPLEVVGP